MSEVKESLQPKSTVRPTKKQKELLSFIEQFIAEHGYSPSYREIMHGTGHTSVATVSLHVNNLIKRGHLAKRDHSARSLEIISSEPKPTEPQIITKQLKAGEEKWLVAKVEIFFKQTEEAPGISEADLDRLHILIGALKVLGLEGAAESFKTRFSALKQKKIDSQYVA